jgi:hypothetical protein
MFFMTASAGNVMGRFSILYRWREKECQNFGFPDKTAIKFLIWTGDDTSHANDTYFDPAMVLAANAFVANSLAEVR